MRLALLGALLVSCGIAARILAAGHGSHLVAAHIDINGNCVQGQSNANFDSCGPLNISWSTAVLDSLHIGTWALLVFGAVILAFSLIREVRR